MIDYIKYTIDGKTYSLIDNGDGTWSKENLAPNVKGNYELMIEISDNGQVIFIDASNPQYDVYLNVISSAERVVFLQRYMPSFLYEIADICNIIDSENMELDDLYSAVLKVESDMIINDASNDAITRHENFLGTKGQGTLEQRKNYLLSLKQKGKKLNEITIKNVTNAISGSDCLVTFFSSLEAGNPHPGYGVLYVRVLSPDNSKDYRYSDIERALKLLVPAHIKLIVIKYFSLWKDVTVNFSDWNSVKSFSNWGKIKNYIPPL